MADDNKTLKYARYAIGEIVLVVIGILIALQINNWNQNRITENKTQRFLLSLKIDLSNDLDAINDVIKEQNHRFIAINELIELSKNPEIKSIIENDTLKFKKAGRNFTFFPVVGAYRAASNSGLIDNVNTEELKINILNLYEHLYIRLNYNGEINDNRYELVDWESRHYIDYTKTELSFDKYALLDKDFIYQLGYLNRFINIYIRRALNTKNAIETIIIQLDKSIQTND